ncbi:MAG: hypothetical protein WEF50_02560 [Myxococcota bacterium]
MSASKKLGRADAVRLVKAATRVIVAKGKTLRSFTPGGKAPAEIVEAVLGPTGNLRAPALRVGDTLVVGWNAEAYTDALS